MAMNDRLGVCQWFHYEDFQRALQARDLLRELGVRHLRMDISWADYHRPDGPAWYRWLFAALAEFDLLPCVWHTPPSLSRTGKSNGPPADPRQFAEFLWLVCNEFGDYFDVLELWNEPNNLLKWDHTCDPDWALFAHMISEGAGTARLYDKNVVLGGMSPINGGWLDTLGVSAPGLLDLLHGVGVHAFPGQWNERDGRWGGWPAVFEHLKDHVQDRSIWITEVGYSASTPASEQQQVRVLEEVSAIGSAARIYFYSLLDLPRSYDELEFSIYGLREPLEHALGLVTETGRRKPAFYVMKELLSDSAGAKVGVMNGHAPQPAPHRPTSPVVQPDHTYRETSPLQAPAARETLPTTASPARTRD